LLQTYFLFLSNHSRKNQEKHYTSPSNLPSIRVEYSVRL
jgi:hypothetical protein